MAFLALYGCQNEDGGVVPSESIPAGFGTNVDYVRLSDNGSSAAGVLRIYADVPAVQLKWNTTGNCNLDTVVKSVVINNGVGELPIKWLAKDEDGNYAPVGMAFRAGVMVTAGKESKYVPLILADKVDEEKLRAHVNLKTRAAGADSIMPKVSEIKVLPETLKLNQTKGGVMSVRLIGVDFAIVDYSAINDAMQLDLAGLPDILEEPTTLLKFTWKPSAPSKGFTAVISFIADEVSKDAFITYVTGELGELTVDEVTDKLPAGGGEHIAATTVSTTEKSWTAVSNQTWLTLDPANGGTGSSTLYFSAEANPYTAARVATVTVTSGAFTESIIITQLGKGATPSLEYVGSSPTGVLPAGQTNYTATFAGTYTGNITLRVSSNGVILRTGSAFQYPTSQPSVLVPANTGSGDRPLTFEYSTNGTEWFPLPETASRMQKGSSSPTVEPDPNTGVNDWGNGSGIDGGKINL